MALRVFASQAAASLRLSARPMVHRLFLREFSSKYPENLKYAKTHEWLKADGGHGTMGLTSFAVHQLGDLVYVELPEVGAKYEAGDTICTVESVKASSSVYAPVGGEVTEVNSSVKESPEKIHQDPYDVSWLVKLKIDNPKQLDSLLSASAYHEFVEKEQH